MPDLLILIGTLGGLFLFGPVGFIIGPLVCGLFLTVWEIYGATFKDVLPPVGDLVTGEIKKADAKLTTSKKAKQNAWTDGLVPTRMLSNNCAHDA